MLKGIRVSNQTQQSPPSLPHLRFELSELMGSDSSSLLLMLMTSGFVASSMVGFLCRENLRDKVLSLVSCDLSLLLFVSLERLEVSSSDITAPNS